MMGFKSHILTESAKAKHALKFLEYEMKDHSKIMKAIKEKCIKNWSNVISYYPELEEDLSLEGRKKTILRKIEIDTSLAKVGRFTSSYVSPSVKIGKAYSNDVIIQVQEDLLEVALIILRKIAEKLNQGLKGSPFYASQEDGKLGDIRLKFKTGEFKKTIALVSIEEGYKFNRLYIKDFLKNL